MSCAAFTLLSVYTALWGTGQESAWILRGSALLAILFFVVGAYKAWKAQYDARLTAERELNRAADIRGDIWVSLEETPEEEKAPLGAVVLSCFFDCVNRGNKACELTQFSVEATAPDWRSFPLGELRISPAPVVVEPERAFIYQATGLPIGGIPAEKIQECKPKVILLDSLGTRYTNTVTTLSKTVSRLDL